MLIMSLDLSWRSSKQRKCAAPDSVLVDRHPSPISKSALPSTEYGPAERNSPEAIPSPADRLGVSSMVEILADHLARSKNGGKATSTDALGKGSLAPSTDVPVPAEAIII
jgi:hypothetical protein